MRNYSRGELIADACIHVLGVTAGVLAIGIFLTCACPALSPLAITSVAVYGSTMIAMLAFSACYHLIPVAAWKNVLRRCDHAAIFLKIAGTYTPFALAKIGGAWGYILLALVWAIALIGGGAKLILGPGSGRLSIPLYLALGWIGVLFIGPIVETVPPTSLLFLGLGGLAYSVGVIFHIWDRLPYQNAVWHAFVLAGTALHFVAVTTAVT